LKVSPGEKKIDRKQQPRMHIVHDAKFSFFFILADTSINKHPYHLDISKYRF
jgi:hypothetical protein